MTEWRIVPCDICGGDGGADGVAGHDWNGPIWRWFKCEHCDGHGEIEVELLPVGLEDIEP